MDESENNRSARYDVGDEIARGGMGEVKDARDLHLDRSVALKVIREDRGVSSDMKQRFVQEARILAKLEHPNIIPVHDLDKDEQGRVFYTMKKVQGLNLKQVLDGIRSGDAEVVAKHSLSQLLNVFQKVCDAMAYAHSRGIIHRDLKPENIMLGEFGEVWVMDWGLAKVLADGDPSSVISNQYSGASDLAAFDGDSALTMDGAVMGTPQFMAPEQAEGRVVDQDARTDIFALGGVLYSILTLRAPTSGSSIEEILENIISGYIPPPIIYNKSKRLLPGGLEADAPIELSHCPGGRAPEALSAVTMTAMAVGPGDRYQSVEELQEEIRAFQGGFATSVEEAGTLRQMVLFVRRNPIFSVMGAIIFLLILGSLGIWFRSEMRKQAEVENLNIAKPLLEAHIAAKIAGREFEEALEAVEDLLKLESDSAKFWNQKGNILVAQLEFDEAATAYGRSLALDEGHADSRESLELCRALLEGDSAGDPGEGELQQFAKLMSGQSRFAVAEAFRERLTVSSEDKAKQLEVYRAALLEKGVAKRIVNALRIQADTNLKFTKPSLVLQLEGENIDSLAPFQGIPIEGINIASTGITDLSPVKGMPLRGLNIDRTRINDLSPLRGMDLEYLRAYFGNLSDLGPLRDMPLMHLALQGNHEIKDLGPLASLTSLRELYLSENKVTDISALRDLPLATLHIHRMPVTDFSPLKGKPLLDLGASEGPISDLSFVRDMPLTNLFLYASDKITDFSPLKTLTKLQSLTAQSTQLSDLSVLEGLPLKSLLLSGCAGVSDLGPLKGMQLENLNLNSTLVSDLSPLAGMPLAGLALFSSQVRDLSPLKGMQLDSLSLSRTRVSDLTPLAGMPLTGISLRYTQVRDLSPLKGMRLQWVHISSTQIGDLGPLAGMPLTEIELASTRVTDLSPLKGMKLTRIDLAGCRIGDLSPLAGMPLTSIGAADADIENLEPLKSMPDLDWVVLAGTKVNDLTPLIGLSLRMINLAGAPITDISPLIDLPLQELNLSGCDRLHDVSALASCRKLELLTIPVNARGIEGLREHPSLKKLAYQLPDSGNWGAVPDITEFWKAYAARKKR